MIIAQFSLSEWTGLCGAFAGVLAGILELWRYKNEARTKLDCRASLGYTHSREFPTPTWVVTIQVINRSHTSVLLNSAGVYGAIHFPDPVASAIEAYRQRSDPVLKNPPPIRHGIPERGIKLERGDAREFNIPLPKHDYDAMRLSGEYWGVEIHLRDGSSIKIDGDEVLNRCRKLPRWMLRRLPRRWRLASWYIKQGWPDEPVKSISGKPPAAALDSSAPKVVEVHRETWVTQSPSAADRSSERGPSGTH